MSQPPMLPIAAHMHKVDSAWIDYVYSFIEEFAISAIRGQYHEQIELYQAAGQINNYIIKHKTPGSADKFGEIDYDMIVKALGELSRNGRSGFAEFKNDDRRSELNIQLPNCNRNVLKPRVYQMSLGSRNGLQYLTLINYAQNVRWWKTPAEDDIADVSDLNVANRFRANKSQFFFLFGVDNPHLLKTITGWWWGKAKTTIGYVQRPLGRDIINKYGCVLRFIIQNCEFDMTRQERARHALERHLRREVMERIKKRLDDRIGQGCSYAEIEFFFFEPYMIDMDLVIAWYEAMDQKPFQIDYDTRTAKSNIERAPIGWNRDSSDDEAETTGSEFTELPSTTVAMEPLYAPVQAAPSEANNNQKQPSLIPCRKGRFREWLDNCKAKKSLVPQRNKQENAAAEDSDNDEIKSIVTDLDNTSIGITSIDTFASKLASSSSSKPPQVTSSCAGRGGYNAGKPRGGARGSKNRAPLRPLTAATIALNERLSEARLTEERRKQQERSMSNVATSPAIDSYLKE